MNGVKRSICYLDNIKLKVLKAYMFLITKTYSGMNTASIES